jgi:transposase
MSIDRKTYTKEFKLEVLHMHETTDKSQAQLERELGIGAGNISRWRKELQEQGEQKVFPGKGVEADADERLKQLERENRLLREELEILKKALAIFSQDQR